MNGGLKIPLGKHFLTLNDYSSKIEWLCSSTNNNLRVSFITSLYIAFLVHGLLHHGSQVYIFINKPGSYIDL